METVRQVVQSANELGFVCEARISHYLHPDVSSSVENIGNIFEIDEMLDEKQNPNLILLKNHKLLELLNKYNCKKDKFILHYTGCEKDQNKSIMFIDLDLLRYPHEGE